MFTDKDNSNSKTLSTLKSKLNDSLVHTPSSHTTTLPSLESNNSVSMFSYIIKIVRYILVIYLVLYILLTILNQLDLLPSWLKDLFSPFDLVEKIYYNNTNKKVKDDKEDQQLATSIQKDNPRPESIPPTPLPQEGNPLPKPDLSTSTTQSSKIANKSGYCYIGEDRGFRSCIKIKQGDKCMSGNIFPTEAICINPNLRP
jgi:hypothetical protein